MRFRTIWTLKGLPMRERLIRTREWAAMEFGSRLPLRVRYWVTMQELAKATRDSSDIPGTSLNEILDHLESPKSTW